MKAVLRLHEARAGGRGRGRGASAAALARGEVEAEDTGITKDTGINRA
jgi:hypothetical protein